MFHVRKKTFPALLLLVCKCIFSAGLSIRGTKAHTFLPCLKARIRVSCMCLRLGLPPPSCVCTVCSRHASAPVFNAGHPLYAYMVPAAWKRASERRARTHLTHNQVFRFGALFQQHTLTHVSPSRPGYAPRGGGGSTLLPVSISDKARERFCFSLSLFLWTVCMWKGGSPTSSQSWRTYSTHNAKRMVMRRRGREGLSSVP